MELLSPSTEVNEKLISEFIEPVKEQLVMVKWQGCWYFLFDHHTANCSEDGQAMDLPLVKAPVLSPHAPVSRALEELRLHQSYWGLVIEGQEILGVVSLNRIMNEILDVNKRTLETLEILSTIFQNLGTVCLRIGSPEEKVLTYEDLRDQDIYVFGDTQKLLGCSSDELEKDLGLWFDRIHHSDRKKHLEVLNRVLETGEEGVSEYRFKHPGKDWIWLRERLCLRRRPNEKRTVFYGLYRDVTRERKEKKYEMLANQIREALAMRAPGEGLQNALQILGKELPIDGAVLWYSRPPGEVSGVIQWARAGYEEKIEALAEEMRRSFMTKDKNGKPLVLKLESFIKTASKERQGAAQAIYIPDLAKSSYPASRVCSRHGLSSAFILKVAGDKRRNCYLRLVSSRVDAFDEFQRSFLEKLQPVFAAVVQAWRYEKELEELNLELRRRTSVLQSLHEFSDKLRYVGSYDEFVRIVADHVRSVVGCNVAAVLLVVGNFNEIFLSCDRRVTNETIRQAKAELIECWMGMGGGRQDAANFRIRVGEPEYPESAPVDVLGSILRFSLTAGKSGEAVGVLLVGSQNEDGFAGVDRHLMDTLANYASASVERLRAVMADEQQRRLSAVGGVGGRDSS